MQLSSDILAFDKVKLPLISIDGYEVLTKQDVKDLNISYIKGISTVKVKSGQVKFKSTEPNVELSNILTEHVKDYNNGTYEISYTISNIENDIMTDIDSSKVKSKTVKVLRNVGGAVLLAGLIFGVI